MKLFTEKFLYRIGFRQQLILTLSLGIILLSVITSIATISVSHHTVYQQLIEQGQHVTDNFAKQSKLALLYQSSENAADAITSTLVFSDVLGLGIYNPNHAVLIDRGDVKFPPIESTSPSSSPTPSVEGPDAWFFTAPVLIDGSNPTDEESPFTELQIDPELIGYVRVMVSKNTLHAMERKIVVSNVSITLALALVLLLLLLTITARVTRPLKELAANMGCAERGEYGVRARLFGSKDIQDMEVAFNTMICELEKRERELEIARDSALSLAQIKGEFAANVTHELRTPMNGVMGMLQLLQRTELSPKQGNFLRVAKVSGDSLLKLIDEILDFSKLESGKITIHPVTFDPREMVREITELLSHQAGEKQLQIEYSCADSVPPLLRADADRIRQVLINLVANAIKFTHEGGVYIHLSSLLQGDDSRVLGLSVRDTGIGIAAHAITGIFEAFVQVDSSITRHFGGTGLGLAICKQLVELMRGTIEISSVPDQGSVFTFSIPVEEVLEAECSENSIVNSSLSQLNVLLATTEEKHTGWLNQTFKEWGSVTRRVSSAQEALAVIHEADAVRQSFDLLIVAAPLADTSAAKLLCDLEQSPLSKKPLVMVLVEEDDPSAEALPENARYFIGPLDQNRFYSAVLKILEVIQLPAIQHSDDKPEKLRGQTCQRILIAEDNRSNQYVVLGMLEQMGYSADVVNDGTEVVNALQKSNYGLILMDCIMPKLDGYETTRRIRQLENLAKDIPIIALTANAGADSHERCISAGMNDHISKPVDLEVLDIKLRKWLQNGECSEQEANSGEGYNIAPQQPLLAVNKKEPVNKPTLRKLKDKIGSRYCAVISAFIEDAPADLCTMERATESCDYDVIKTTAHRLKGSSLNLGAGPLADTCTQIEIVADNQEPKPLQLLISQAKGELNALEVELNHELMTAEMIPQQDNEIESVILIADDDRSARLTLMGTLEYEGYRLLQAANGKEAVDICRFARPDLVLLDVMMPVMDGLNACKEILDIQNDYNPPVLMITALHDDTAIEKAFVSGATDFVTKPVNLTVIRHRIARLVKNNKTEKHVQQLAYYDTLTNLPNREQFIRRVTEMMALAEDNDSGLSLLFLDLDRFKNVNDSLGHEAGDMLLKMVASRLKESVRKSDLVARFGGDEFTIAMGCVEGPELATKIAQKICRTLADPYMIEDKKVFISGSIGIALYPDHGSTVQSLMKEADTAMFKAKSQGGGCFRFFEKGMDHKLIERMDLENDLRVAIEKNQLEIYYQPQSDLFTDSITGVEALLRWRHADRGLISPGEFIPLAEESGLINSIGDWVLENACRQMRSWLDQGLPAFTMSINISKYQMRFGDLAERVAQILRDLQLPAELVKLEITESAIEDDPEGMMDLLNRIRATGVTLAIDDFGTGYSSLSYLKRFPLDTLKIDISFIKDITDDPDSSAIVAGIIALGHSLRMKLIAEGVETKAQQDLLRQLKCDQIQGYLLAKPMPAEEFVDWLLQLRALDIGLSVQS